LVALVDGQGRAVLRHPIADLAAEVVHLVLVFLAIRAHGLDGAGNLVHADVAQRVQLLDLVGREPGAQGCLHIQTRGCRTRCTSRTSCAGGSRCARQSAAEQGRHRRLLVAGSLHRQPARIGLDRVLVHLGLEQTHLHGFELLRIQPRHRALQALSKGHRLHGRTGSRKKTHAEFCVVGVQEVQKSRHLSCSRPC
jgi:hypothetical protein